MLAPHCTGYESSLCNCAQSVRHVENYNYAGVKCSPGKILLNIVVCNSSEHKQGYENPQTYQSNTILTKTKTITSFEQNVGLNFKH